MTEDGQGSQARLLEWGDFLVFFLFGLPSSAYGGISEASICSAMQGIDVYDLRLHGLECQGNSSTNTMRHGICRVLGNLPSLNPHPPVLQHPLRLLIVRRLAAQDQGILQGPPDRDLHPARVPTDDEDGRAGVPVDQGADLVRVPADLVLDVHLAAVVVEALQPGHVGGVHGLGPGAEVLVLGPDDVQGLLPVGVEEGLVGLRDGVAREGGDDLEAVVLGPLPVVVEVRIPVPGAKEEQHTSDLLVCVAFLYDAANRRDAGPGANGNERSLDVDTAGWGRVPSQQPYGQYRSWFQGLDITGADALGDMSASVRDGWWVGKR